MQTIKATPQTSREALPRFCDPDYEIFHPIDKDGLRKHTFVYLHIGSITGLVIGSNGQIFAMLPSPL